MRPIKFRAFDINYKKMLTPKQLEDSGVHLHASGCLFITDINDKEILCERLEAMQFTGLHDKNGREIYEGDILIPRDMHDCNIDSWTHKEPTEKDPYSCIGIPMQVKWIEHMCGFDVPPNTQYWEVIGNIHENPELLTTLYKGEVRE